MTTAADTDRPCPEPAYQVEKLREAAEHLGGPSTWQVDPSLSGVRSPWDGQMTYVRMVLPSAVCKPLRGVLLEAAERIELAGSTLGLPVNYALEIAGLILSEDLGHNR